MLTEKQQKAAAAAFAQRWQGRGYEKGESQSFWLDLLASVYGVEQPTEYVRFEQQVMLDHTSFVDAVIPSTHVLIEQKSLGKDLRQPIRQSDGSLLKPIEQAQRYSGHMSYSERPRWIVVCNFAEWDVYDLEHPHDAPQHILLANLEQEYRRLQFLTDSRSDHIRAEEKASTDAGKIVAQIYDALLPAYGPEPTAEDLRQLNILCVRIVFCLYAEDACIFPRHNQFSDFLAQFPTADLHTWLTQLFQALATPAESRSRFMRADLMAFPYAGGDLFAEPVDVPPFTDALRKALLEIGTDFDWSQISPTIFGAVFESTLNPDTRRSGGMHYTSIANIHRVIDPLFLSDLERRYSDIMEMRDLRQRTARLKQLQQHMASLTFFDPACGSGNFLTETYLSLRRLENRLLRAIHQVEPYDIFADPIQVSIHQFYGIEINDFAVTVATTALWISEAQTMQETESILSHDIDFLPLRSYANIREGNALRIDWSEVIAPDRLNYIIGNPPFVGARLMSEAQKADMLAIFGPEWKNVGNIDYVGAWYKRAADYMAGSTVQAALVSTNSISQGEQVANLWSPLLAQGLCINFAYRTFRWDSESTLKAHVHVVIIGFSYVSWSEKQIFDNEKSFTARHINAYLIDAPDICVGSRNKPLCDVPDMGIGNKPIDGGNYLFTKEEMEEFVKREPRSARLFHEWYGAEEFIHRKPRYCLWLGDCSPAEIKSMPLCYQRVANVRQLRLESKSAGTRKLADTPTRFHVENMPDGDSILVPCHSSENRKYIPMGFIPKGTFATNAVLIIPSATLYHFGILESNVHMAWMRAVCGRLEMRYRYSKEVVYNNFPWPTPTAEQEERIRQTAQGILDARAQKPDSSLADLYDPALMPPALLEAHRRNDRAVMDAYGFSTRMTEPECTSRLLELYARLAKG